MAVPCRAINRSGSGIHEAVMFHLSDFADSSGSVVEACEWADVIVVQRNTFGPVLAAMDYWKMKGKAIVMDFDDAFQTMHKTNVSYEFWELGIHIERDDDGKEISYEKISPPPIMQLRSGVRKAHLLTTPSKRLCADWARDAVQSVYLPNYLDLTMYPPQESPNDGLIRIGWGGSLGHPQSIKNSGVIEAIAEICKKRKHVRMMFCGADTRIARAFEWGGLGESLIKQSWVPFNEWYKVLYQFDIAIAPLSGQYDQRRSWIKLGEAMYAKIPWVASKSDTYNDFGEFGILTDNMVPTWRRSLLNVIDNYDEWKQKAEGKPYEYACSMSADLHVEDYVRTYQMAVDERDRSK